MNYWQFSSHSFLQDFTYIETFEIKPCMPPKKNYHDNRPNTGGRPRRGIFGSIGLGILLLPKVRKSPEPVLSD